ncbi:DUF4105 domain-containing protein, partial [Luteimonas sp. SDU101]|uniref:DUF7844 domain-containing protein n=1 Tax=Luteimonas sp. SDU101 TaxID=3422593 RepID=UPI003EB83BB8
MSPRETAATQELVDAALARLPPRLLAELDREVPLRWRDDLPTRVHGRTRGGAIALDRALLEGWVQRDPNAVDDPRARAALAALLHELAHVHDRSPAGGLSADPRLLDLAGWPVRPLRLGLRAGRNDFRDRSPDPYELASPAEFVAVNLEHYLLDPEYACRRPALHRYFASRLGAPPALPDAACADALPFVAAAHGGDPGLDLLALDPARVVAVEYLLAEPARSPMSRWGHGMLRLVVCAPDRAPGPDCRLDLDHHLVLSFRAFVDDVQVSNWRGLTGRYPSRLFVLPLAQVVDEYTRVELRGLRSVPLRLAPGQVAAVLERAAQVHWGYDGRYYFVSNNCAVESWKLLNDALPALSQRPLRSITPTGLLRRLQRAGIADASVLEDAGQARRLGYRFESLSRYFQDMYAVVAAELALAGGDAEAWLRLDPLQRRDALGRGGLRATAALLVLEEAALRREQVEARDALRQRYWREDAMEGQVAGLLQALWSDGAGAGRPAGLLPDAGYGLPQGQERAVLGMRVAE